MFRAIGCSFKVKTYCPKPQLKVNYKSRIQSSNGLNTLVNIRTLKSTSIMWKPANSNVNKPEPLDEELESFLKSYKVPEVVIPAELAGNPDLHRKIHLGEVMAILQQEHAEHPVVIDTKTKCSWLQYMIIVSGKSRRHMKAIGDRLVKELRYRVKTQSGINTHLEGEDSEDWMCVDAGDHLIHIMSERGRTYYGLERLWAMKHTAQGASDELELRDLEEGRKEIQEIS